jgi:hypothetical protein
VRPRGRMVASHGLTRVRADAHCFIPGNFKKDATVRPSHGRPRGHCPSVRPSVRKRPRDNPGTVGRLITLSQKFYVESFEFCTDVHT